MSEDEKNFERENNPYYARASELFEAWWDPHTGQTLKDVKNLALGYFCMGYGFGVDDAKEHRLPSPEAMEAYARARMEAKEKEKP